MCSWHCGGSKAVGQFKSQLATDEHRSNTEIDPCHVHPWLKFSELVLRIFSLSEFVPALFGWPATWAGWLQFDLLEDPGLPPLCGRYRRAADPPCGSGDTTNCR